MTEDEAVAAVLAIARAELLFTSAQKDAFEIALPRIQEALRLAEAVKEWGSRYLRWRVEPDMIVEGEDAGRKLWRVTDYDVRKDEYVIAEGDSLPEAVASLRKKLSEQA